MDKDIIKKIRNTEWWEGEGPAVFQLIQLPTLGFSKMALNYPGLKFSGLFVVGKNNYGYQFISKEENISWTSYLIENHRKDKNYIRDKIKEWLETNKKAAGTMKEINKINLADVNNKKLLSLFRRFFRLMVESWSISLILEGSGIYFDEILTPKSKISPEELPPLAKPEKLSFSAKEHISLLKIAIEIASAKIPKDISLKELKKKHFKIFKKIRIHQRKFFWIRNNYKNVKVISSSDFFKEAKDISRGKNKDELKKEVTEIEESVKKRQKLRKKLSISSGIKKELEAFSLFGSWMDQRKELNIKSNYYLHLLIKEISSRAGLKIEQGYNLSNKEIEKFLLGGKIDKKEIAKSKLYVFLCQKNKYRIFYGKEALILKNELFNSLKGNQKDNKLKGTVASTGKKDKISGRVRIVLDVSKEKFKQGNILVTSMTRPEFVPLMKKAKAIVTNEGGITSHAAIVSRELNIPCIIGTKIATKVLKNGDLVEVDVDKGVVKIIKRANS